MRVDVQNFSLTIVVVVSAHCAGGLMDGPNAVANGARDGNACTVGRERYAVNITAHAYGRLAGATEGIQVGRFITLDGSSVDSRFASEVSITTVNRSNLVRELLATGVVNVTADFLSQSVSVLTTTGDEAASYRATCVGSHKCLAAAPVGAHEVTDQVSHMV